MIQAFTRTVPVSTQIAPQQCISTLARSTRGATDIFAQHARSFSLANSSKEPPVYCQRDISIANELEKEVSALHSLLATAFRCVNEMPGLTQSLVKVNHVAMQRILRSDAHSGLSAQNREHLHHFLNDLNIVFGNPQKIKDENQKKDMIQETAVLLINEYYMHTKRFIKMELPGSLQQISCFNYALHKAGFQVNEFALRVLKFWNTPDPFSRDLVLSSEYIVFLKNRGMAQAMPPFQSNDIIVYFDDRNVARHAAVAANDKWVYAKLGNRTRHAYLHKEIETPPHYGTKFQIYRARLA